MTAIRTPMGVDTGVMGFKFFERRELDQIMWWERAFHDRFGGTFSGCLNVL